MMRYPMAEMHGTKKSSDMYLKEPSQSSHIFVNKAGEIVIPKPDILNRTSHADLRELYHRYIQNIQIRCRRQIHLGAERDGGYHICEDPEVAPVRPCLIYSFGIRNDFSFDDDISKTFGCEVHSFDPGDGQTDHRHSPSVMFHNLGIGGTNVVTPAGWQLKTLNTIRHKLGHSTRRLDILKIDTEGAEWSSIREMLQNKSIDDVRQLIVEFHVFLGFRSSWLDRRKESYYREQLHLLRGLYECGFRIFYFRMWNFAEKQLTFTDETGNVRTGCHEVHFMKATDKQRSKVNKNK